MQAQQPSMTGNAMPATPTRKPFNFMALPLELRRQICHAYLAQKSTPLLIAKTEANGQTQVTAQWNPEKVRPAGPDDPTDLGVRPHNHALGQIHPVVAAEYRSEVIEHQLVVLKIGPACFKDSEQMAKAIPTNISPRRVHNLCLRVAFPYAAGYLTSSRVIRESTPASVSQLVALIKRFRNLEHLAIEIIGGPDDEIIWQRGSDDDDLFDDLDDDDDPFNPVYKGPEVDMRRLPSMLEIVDRKVMKSLGYVQWGRQRWLWEEKQGRWDIGEGGAPWYTYWRRVDAGNAVLEEIKRLMRERKAERERPTEAQSRMIRPLTR